MTNKLIVDIDGTLCPIKTEHESYSDLVPYVNMVEKLREYKKAGYEIVLNTSRNMKTYHGNIGKIQKHTAPVLIEWLTRNDIPFDEIHYGKPWPGPEGFYIDDRSIRPSEFLYNTKDEIDKIHLADRDLNKTNIVITMAGMSSRFEKAGYTVPKFMIKVKGLTLFQWSLLSLSKFTAENSKLIFITQKKYDASDFIKENCLSLGIKKIHIIELEYATDGQATTAFLANTAWNKKAPLLIYNIDTYVEPNVLSPELIFGDGWIPCMNVKGDHWSFVKTDGKGFATDVQEKKRISDNCSIGLYWFKDCELYEKCYYAFYVNGFQDGKEKYIAPMYNWLLSNNVSVGMSVIENVSVHPLGTPEELKIFKEWY